MALPSTCFVHSIPKLASVPRLKLPFIFHMPVSCPSALIPSRFRCNCSLQEPALDISAYKEKFSKRMAMAGLKPHHRIALGVSGGPDSMALCVLAAAWKTTGLNSATKIDGFIDGLLAIVVDHGLRAESGQEAKTVQQRVSNMGIRCEIGFCEWTDGKPEQGHLQEEAREMRYQIFQRVCTKKQFGVLLIAHHADDQAELFIIRLSRNSGVLGLAGMAFTSELFSKYTHSHVKNSDRGILVVRPLLDFSKEDLYEICRRDQQNWVEDPSNRSSSYVRNRIRMSLQNFSSTSTFMSELRALIFACRRTRLYVDKKCSDLVTRSLSVTDLGYAVIDLPALDASNVDDVSLAKFCSTVLQFISQRHRPVRGSTSKLLLNYFRTSPCKSSLTAAGCYLSPAPGSKGAKILVCCSANCPMPPKTELFCLGGRREEQKHFTSNELKEIVNAVESYLDLYCPDASDVQFLDTSSSVLSEAKRLNIISESTYRSILSMQEEEMKRFKPKHDSDYERKTVVESVSTSQIELLQPGEMGNFMNRFLISWKWDDELASICGSCHVGHMAAAEVRLMEERDWLYLSQISKCESSENGLAKSCFEQARSSASQSLRLLKHIPAAARRSLPVLVDSNGVLLSIPILGFKSCPRLEVSCGFNPRVPLRGGHTSFI